MIHLPLCTANGPPLPVFVAQQAGKHAQDVVLSLVLIMLGAAVIALVGFLMHRWMRRPDEPAATFGLAELRLMHREGKLTDEEFERAKAVMVAGFKSSLHRDTPDEGEPNADLTPDATPPDDVEAPDKDADGDDAAPPRDER